MGDIIGKVSGYPQQPQCWLVGRMPDGYGRAHLCMASLTSVLLSGCRETFCRDGWVCITDTRFSLLPLRSFLSGRKSLTLSQEHSCLCLAFQTQSNSFQRLSKCPCSGWKMKGGGCHRIRGNRQCYPEPLIPHIIFMTWLPFRPKLYIYF